MARATRGSRLATNPGPLASNKSRGNYEGPRLRPEYLSDDNRIAEERLSPQRSLPERKMETTGARARSTRKPRLSDAERRAKAARPAGRGRLPRVVKAKGGKLPRPANDTVPPDLELADPAIDPTIL